MDSHRHLTFAYRLLSQWRPLLIEPIFINCDLVIMKWIIIALVLLLSMNNQLLAQEIEGDGRLQKLPDGVKKAEHRLYLPGPREVASPRIHPPFWWIGMEEPTVELMIHDTDIADFTEVRLVQPGVKVQAVTRLESPNYLFLTLHIGDNARAGEFELVLRNTTGAQRSYRYRLQERAEGQIDPLTPADFIYLLMPDRFANGDPSNDVVEGMHQTGIDRQKLYFRHGGDLQGVIDHLDYLQDLGVTALWINPVQENDQPYESYHGYAVTDHYRIDPRLGDNALYRELSEECQRRGIKLVMDIIHNHAGDQHFFIQDIPSEDWIHQFEKFTKTTYRAPVLMDPYASTYDRERMSDGWFDAHMPDLNQAQPQLARYLIQNNIWWIEYAGLDAYRIDTYAYPNLDFMKQWARAIRQEYPEFFLFAETWVHGPGVQAFFGENRMESPGQGTLMSGVTDFQLYYAINEALNQDQGWTSGAARVYFTLAQDYLYQQPEGNVVFLDNHDLSRFYSVVEEDFRKFKLGTAFLLTTRGVPMMYYGTEILMKNKAEPDGLVREDFPGGWAQDTVNKFVAEGRTGKEQEAFDWVRNLARFRKSSPALTAGQLVQFVPEEGVYVYARIHPEQKILVVLNTQDQQRVLDLSRFQEVLKGYTGYQDVVEGGEQPLPAKLIVPGYGLEVWALR